MRIGFIARVVGGILAVAAATALAAGSSPAVAQQTGSIAGIVRFAGKPPARARIDITKDKSVCGKTPHFEQTLIVAPSGGIKNVVVTVTGAPGAVKPVTATFDQKACEYVPHVIAIPVGSTVAILNSDPVLHSVHGYRGDKTLFDMAQPWFKKRITYTVKTPGPLRIMCDEHGWMDGWWFVTDTPYYAVTGADGKFTIKDVPPGTYAIHAWQEKLGTREQKVTVKAGATATADFTYAPK